MGDEEDFVREFDSIKHDPEKVQAFLTNKMLVIEAQMIMKTLKSPVTLIYAQHLENGEVHMNLVHARDMRDIQAVINDVMITGGPIGLISIMMQLTMALYDRLYTN